MKTLIRFASVMEALPQMDPVDPRSDRGVVTRRSAFAGACSTSVFPQA